LEFPSRRIVVNLAPADSRKEGPFFDLPIAVGILIATEAVYERNIDKTVFIGELSLDGKINRVNGILPMCIEAKRLGIKRAVIPEENSREAAVVSGIDILPAKTLVDVIAHLNGVDNLKPATANAAEFFTKVKQHKFDFLDVRGQENIKRALEISAAGRSQLPVNRKSGLTAKL